MEVDKHGNCYITGTHVVNDTPKVVCAKYNSDGVLLWSTPYVYPVEAYIRPSGMALDSSGNVFVIADQGPAYFLPTNGLIMKFNNANGSVAWVRRYIGQYGWGAFRDIKIDRENNIYVAGWTDSSHLVIRYNGDGDSVWARKYRPPWGVRETIRACTLDDSLNITFTGLRRFLYPPFGYYDSLLVGKYSSNGLLRWESVYASDLLAVNEGIKITADQNGNLYIGGITTVSGDGVYLTVKYDRNGIRQWAKIYDAPGSGSNTLTGIVIDKTNNALYATGGAVTNGVQMATTIKYNSLTGDSTWVRKDTGTYKYGDARAIRMDDIGNIYITGVSSSTGTGAPVDLLTIKYLQTGAKDWQMTYNGPFNGLDIGKDLRLDRFNNVYVLVTSESSSGVRDYVVIKYSQLTSNFTISGQIPSEFILNQNYPNPFNPSTKIKFSIPKTTYVQVQIYDILGRTVKELVSEFKDKGVYSVTFDGTGLASGVYFYTIEAGTFKETKKMVLVK